MTQACALRFSSFFSLFLLFFISSSFFSLSLLIYHHCEGLPQMEPLSDPNADPRSDLRPLYSMRLSICLLVCTHTNVLMWTVARIHTQLHVGFICMSVLFSHYADQHMQIIFNVLNIIPHTTCGFDHFFVFPATGLVVDLNTLCFNRQVQKHPCAMQQVSYTKRN